MSLKNATIPNETKLAVVREIIRQSAKNVRQGRPGAEEQQRVLKSIAAELDSRVRITSLGALRDIEMHLENLKGFDGPHTNNINGLAGLGMAIVHHWPMIRIAIETYRETT